MGNPDLVFIFNDCDVYIIKGTDYQDREGAVILAMTMHNRKWIDIAKGHPKLTVEAEAEINSAQEIRSIKIYEH